MECICGLASAVTDLLQSVELEYHGYQGEAKQADSSQNKGATDKQVTNHLNGLFSLVQGLGGTAVVRTYIDQLAQVLSALVGWSKIVKCSNGGKDKCKGGGTGNEHGEKPDCGYLTDVTANDPCKECGCMKWNDPDPNSNEGHHLGRRCQRCSDSGGSTCKCSGTSGGACTGPGQECQCAKEGKCCKCCCNKKCGKCKEECSCIIEDGIVGSDECNRDSYMSAYPSDAINIRKSFLESERIDVKTRWNNVTSSPNRHQCARIFLGSVCLIWSGLTYMYWTGKYHKSSPRWNNHILDGSGLDDGTLSQWLQALGFPKEMLNNHGPGNRLDAVIWDGIRGMLYLGFPHTTDNAAHGKDYNDNTFRQPAGMNYAGYIHTVDKGAFDSSVFKGTGNGIDKNKLGALFKLYILSCAYFTGLQKKSSTQSSTSTTPRTIREILYWLSALPYSQAYKDMLDYAKERLKKEAPDVGDKKQLSFLQTGRNAPITVHEFNLFAHFQAVTQYCPLVLIGIQGGLHSATKGTDSTKEPPIHSLYANTECHFTYPTVSIQAYNQVVHYIRALFYQLYFLRKQCAVKVALGGKWRECRYGKDVVSKGVISWMCLGCDPMEHDRNYRVKEMGNKLNKLPLGSEISDSCKLKDLLEKIGDVVVQLGNAQEALEGKDKKAIEGVKEALQVAKEGLDTAKNGLDEELKEAKDKLGELTNGSGGSGALHTLVNSGPGSLHQVSSSEHEWQKDYSSAKDRISAAIDGLHKVLEIFKKWAEQDETDIIKQAKSALEHLGKITGVGNEVNLSNVKLEAHYSAILAAIKDLLSICNFPKCSACDQHGDKCGQPSNPTICQTCLQPTTTGVPSPLQAFLEDRLPGFSCKEVLDQDMEENPTYPPAASHLGHCSGSGQCCPLPMGFRNQFHKGSTSDSTGARLYGILYFFSNENMMQSCVYTLVRVTAALSATTPQVLGDVFGFFRGGVGNPEEDKEKRKGTCNHDQDPRTSTDNNKYFCGWCASGLRDEVKKIGWIPKKEEDGGKYRGTVGQALINIKGDKDTGASAYSDATATTNNLSTLTDGNHYVSPLTGELYTAVSATFGNVYLSWVLYLSDALEGGLQSLSDAFRNIECRGCKGQCDPNKCKKGEHGQKSTRVCGCSSIVSCTGVLPVLYRHGFSYGNPFNLEGYQQKDGKTDGQYDIVKAGGTKRCHEFLDSLQDVIKKKEEEASSKDQKDQHPLTKLLSEVGQLQYDIRLPWIFVLTLAWLVAVLYLAFGAIWPLDWTHMRSHCRGWFRKGSLSPWEVLMVGKKKGRGILEYFGRK
ncbi:variant erythrocyte surface antigen-1 alpha subunit [Babesia bovis T2Bo]|uniref:Variant erythrocyte surface antigen-1, alpha subunit n=1 Tax=Babesia bovis TaxID=5865 RepID=A7ATC2_BABBO|nr:variant erythrocyte surface antigen-1 alpha subunit [Babesia bovis T2Bo]EDO06183.1 variant erythrocyte surface antigen-1 alpha subunit [Babesia bovis T2Bo]|eukprot:XP_001609751.1 variant erythrocyte surface antigen-1, alpha subunit [Babesia bovis T2Bo]